MPSVAHDALQATQPKRRRLQQDGIRKSSPPADPLGHHIAFVVDPALEADSNDDADYQRPHPSPPAASDAPPDPRSPAQNHSGPVFQPYGYPVHPMMAAVPVSASFPVAQYALAANWSFATGPVQVQGSPSPLSSQEALAHQDGEGGASTVAIGDGVNGSRSLRLPPILQVEKQHVTTTATQAASASRRRNEAIFKCPVPGCGSTFTRRFNLRGHLRSHTEERPFVCSWPGCGKGFARSHDCKRHSALHTAKQGAHACLGCGKTFSRTDALNRHLKSEGGAQCRKLLAQDNTGDDSRNQSRSVSADLTPSESDITLT